MYTKGTEIKKVNTVVYVRWVVEYVYKGYRNQKGKHCSVCQVGGRVCIQRLQKSYRSSKHCSVSQVGGRVCI